MLKKILIALAAIVLIVVAVGVVLVVLQPSKFEVKRSTTIAAPQADVFAQMGCLVALGEARSGCGDTLQGAS